MKAAQIKLPKEGCARGMEPRFLDVELKDAQMEPSREEFVFDTGHKPNDVATMVAQINQSKEVCAHGTGQR